MKRPLLALAFFTALLSLRAASPEVAPPISQRLSLAPGANNPRNSEGDFVHLRDGRILLIYSHFTGGKGRPEAAYLASRISRDQGQTWSERDATVAATDQESGVLFSVSLLRLQSGRIALFYLQKKAEDDCRLMMRLSSDEAQTWGPAAVCTAGTASFMVNNGRAIQLKTGRILIPASRHDLTQGPEAQRRGAIDCFFSDDDGSTWRESHSRLEAEAKSHSGFQHPTVVELKDGRLFMLMAMHLHPLLSSYSTDGGDTWSKPARTPFTCPVAPPSLKTLPSGDVLLVWNDHRSTPPELKNNRTPLTVAISTDGGASWGHTKNLFEDTEGYFSHTAIDICDHHVLLAHSASHQAKGAAAMAATVITSVDTAWLYR